VKKLKDNRQLYYYLIDIGAKLTERGAADLGQAALAASRLAWTFPQTEFLGESRIALSRIQGEHSIPLNEEERLDLDAIVQQLNSAFADRG